MSTHAHMLTTSWLAGFVDIYQRPKNRARFMKMPGAQDEDTSRYMSQRVLCSRQLVEVGKNVGKFHSCRSI